MRFLTTAAIVMVVMIVIISFWQSFQRKAPSVETGEEISESAPIATSPVDAGTPVSEPGHESTSAETDAKSETSAEERLIETQRILLILAVTAVIILVVVLVWLRFINPEAYKKVIEVLQQIQNLRQTILAKALRGELGTNDPGEASSKELLASIMSGNAGK